MQFLANGGRCVQLPGSAPLAILTGFGNTTGRRPDLDTDQGHRSQSYVLPPARSTACRTDTRDFCSDFMRQRASTRSRPRTCGATWWLQFFVASPPVCPVFLSFRLLRLTVIPSSSHRLVKRRPRTCWRRVYPRCRPQERRGDALAVRPFPSLSAVRLVFAAMLTEYKETASMKSAKPIASSVSGRLRRSTSSNFLLGPSGESVRPQAFFLGSLRKMKAYGVSSSLQTARQPLRFSLSRTQTVASSSSRSRKRLMPAMRASLNPGRWRSARRS